MVKRMSSYSLPAALLALVLAAPALAADNGASATPVPFPEQAPSIPEIDQLQALEADRQDFMRRADRYIMSVQRASEAYRRYMGQVQDLLASCEVQADVDQQQFEDIGFEGLTSDGARLCNDWVAGFEQQARRYAAKLDEAVAFQKGLQKVAEQVQHQLDRIRMLKQARRLKDSVDQGMADVQTSKDSLEPWRD